MDLTTRDDIEAPIAFVFDQVTDFHAFERQALRRGAEVARRDALARPAVGSAWDVRFDYRGRARHLVATIAAWEPPNGLSLTLSSGGIHGATAIEMIALSQGRTRLTVTTRLSASGLAARLLLQSLRLARGTLQDRLSRRVATFAREVEQRHARRT